MEHSMKTDLGNNNGGFILCPLSQPQGMRFHIVTTIQIVGDKIMDNG
jgi:hypothetical protein